WSYVMLSRMGRSTLSSLSVKAHSTLAALAGDQFPADGVRCSVIDSTR
ncbi:MAG: hypothetical protein ACI9LD_001858, partial [Polaromonas sp.]